MKNIEIGDIEAEGLIEISHGPLFVNGKKSIVFPIMAKSEGNSVYFKNVESGYWEFIEESRFNEIDRLLNEFLNFGNNQDDGIIVPYTIEFVISQIEKLKLELYK